MSECASDREVKPTYTERPTSHVTYDNCSILLMQGTLSGAPDKGNREGAKK